MHILVTAGPTQEPIDPVRFIGNRSSGKMGYAIARAAQRRGHAVRLISGPVRLTPPAGVRVTGVRTAAEMLAAVEANVGWCDALIMAAAVADWRPASVSPVKLKKRGMRRTLKLAATADILGQVARHKGGRVFVGFAAETGGDLLPEAARKLRSKRLDLIVANDVTKPGSGFETDTNEVTLLDAGGALTRLPLMSKRRVAGRLVKWVEAHARPAG